MAFTTQLPAVDMMVGGQADVHGSAVTFTNYYVETAEDGGRTIDSEDIFDAAGARKARLIFNRNRTWTATLISIGAARTDALIMDDFPQGLYCTLTGLTTYIVDSAKISKSKSATRVSVSLTRAFNTDAT